MSTVVTKHDDRWEVVTGNIRTVFKDEQSAATQIGLLHDRIAELEQILADDDTAELESEIDFMLDEPEDDDELELDDDDVSDSGELPPEIQEQLDAMKKMARDAGIEVEGDDE